MSDRKTFIVRLKISYEKHWEKISIAAMVLVGLIMLAALIVLVILLYENYYGL